jgi:DNA mismatch repair protein MLH1
MFPVSSPAQINTSEKGKGKVSTQGPPTANKSRLIEESLCLLTSVNALRQNVVKSKHRRKCFMPRGGD